MLCSVKNSGEDNASSLVSSEVDERQSTARLASPVLMQQREASAVPTRICDSTGENSTSHSSHIPSAGRPVATHTHKRKSSRDTRSVQERHLTSERVRSQQQEVRDFLKFRTDEAVGKLYQNSLKRSFLRDCSLKRKEIRFSETSVR